MKIVVVEDEPKVLQLMQMHLKLRGHEVSGCDTGKEALQSLEQQKPQLMLLDMWLKDDISGKIVLGQAKSLSPSTAVIIMTGDEEVSQEEVTKLGGAALLRKPVRLDDLDAAVAKVAERLPAPQSSGQAGQPTSP